jgi:RNA polymerase sigma-70 factor (ECF subfamily)
VADDRPEGEEQPTPALDMARFHELYVEHQREIYKHIFALLPHPADADDVFQDTCLTILRKSDQFRPESSFLHWACQIARFEALNYRRRMQADKLRFNAETLDAIDAARLASSDESQPRREALHGCVDELKPDDRELIIERYRSGATAEEMATRLGRSPHSVRKSIRRIRNMLRVCIERTLAAWERPS